MSRPPLMSSADRILSEAIRNLIDCALNGKIKKRGYLITSNVKSVKPVDGLSGKFAYCEEGTLELVKKGAATRVASMNKAAADRGKFPLPVEFMFSTGDDHCIIWFERPREDD